MTETWIPVTDTATQYPGVLWWDAKKRQAHDDDD